MAKKHAIRIRVNGEEHDLLVDSKRTLLQLLREDLDLTGTKEGCDEGNCGACSVIFNGKAVNSCLVLAVESNDAEITTIEGFHQGEDLHPVQRAFIDSGAIQCGFCSPGMIVTTKAMLDEICEPSEGDIRDYLQGNLCRCTGYVKIMDAVRDAIKKSSKRRRGKH
jgi:carbon-monoxide dehydrogenase small subunit